MAVDVGSAVGYLDLDISGFLAGLKSAQSEADKQSKNIATTIGNNISGIGKGLSSVGTTLTKNVTVPLTAIGVAGLKVATDFEKGMSEVKAISGATGKDFDALREKAIELGADTAFSAGEVAAAMTEMAKAGWSSQQIIDGMSGVLSAAAASGEGLATVATIVADAITGFGLEAKESARVADLLTQAANSGTIGIVDLGESFKYIAPVAGAMGLSVEDVTTALSAMSMAGIKGSQAGTSLRTMLTRLVKPTDAVAVAMEKLGIEIVNQDGSMKSLDDIVSTLRTSFDDLTESEKAKYAATLAGQEGMAGMLALLNLTEEEYNAIAASMENAGGVAEQTAAIMQDNLQSKVEQLGGSLESLAIKLADYVIPYLQKFVEWLTNLADKFTSLDPETQKSILKFAAFAAAIGPVLVVLGNLVVGIGNVITTLGKIPGAISIVSKAFTTLTTSVKNVAEGFKLAKAGFTALGSQASPLGAALAGLSGPVLAVIAVIAALTAAFVTLWKTNEDFRNAMTAIWEQIKATFEKLCSGIVERLNKLGFDFSSIAEVLKAIWMGFCDLLAPVFEGAFQHVANTFDTIVNVILGVLDFFISWFTGDWEGCWNAIKDIFTAIWNGIKDWFTNILNVIKGIFDAVLGWFGTSWTECWDAIKTFFVNIWTSISTWFQTTLTNISTFFQNIWNAISTFFQNLWNNITTFITNALNNIKTTFENIWNAVSNFLSNAWETIKNVVQVGIMFIVELINAAFQLITLPFRFIWENCKETIFVIWDAIKEKIYTVLTAIQTFITSIWNSIKTTITTIVTAISDAISTAWNAIKSTITSIMTAISSAISTAWNAIKSTATTVMNAIKSAIDTAWNAIKTAITNALNAIKSAVTTALNAVKSTVTSVFNSVKSTIDTAWNAVKSTTTSVWNSIKSSISTALNSVKSTVSSIISSIKSTISDGFNAAKSTVSSVFNSIKSAISSAMDGAKSTVSNAINAIKNAFNIKLSFPEIKLPHLSISGEFSLDPPSVPHFSIDWYKKAMGNGMILDTATIFGFNPKTGKFLGGGEAGSETVVGTKNLMSMIRRAVNDAIAPLVIASRELARASAELGYVTYNGFAKIKEVVDKTGGTRENGDGGHGDTFVFYSPKAIDEIEAAKQMKRSKRELAEGF